MIHEYMFDCTLTAAVRVKAETRAKAEEALRKKLDCATLTVDEEVLGEVSIEGELDLCEVDGEWVS